VTTIGEEAFKDNQLTSLTVGNGVTTIKKEAFANNQLASVSMPDSVTSVGERALSNNPLTSVVIPNSIGSLHKNVFSGVRNLNKIIIGDNVELLGTDQVAFNFADFYLKSNFRAGTYTFANGSWSGQFR
jgi:hypothetical protein